MSDTVEQLYQRARAAFEIIEYWPQSKVDEMVAAVAWEWQKLETARDLVTIAMEESEMGVFDDKVAKQIGKVRGAMWDMKGVKTCGVVEEDRAKCTLKIAKPLGVVANIVPSTNPTATPSFLGLCLLKTRNSMIVSPHPRTRRSSYKTIEYGRKALRKIGAPEDLLLCIEQPSNDKTSSLMARCDFVVATGGAGLKKVVYAAGTPAHTTGAGNVVSIIDETAEVENVADMLVSSKVFDNSSGCSMENAVAIHESLFPKMVEALQARGAYLCNTDERESLRKTMWPDGRIINRDIVARSPLHIADLASLSVPDSTRILMVEGQAVGPEDRFSGEKISPVLTIWKWNDFDEILDRLKRILKFSGEGHSASIHTNNKDRILELSLRTNVGRISCNMPHAFTNSGGWSSGQPFTVTLAGGTWAGNMTSDNVNWRHFLNYTIVAEPIENAKEPTDEELFGEFLDQLQDGAVQ